MAGRAMSREVAVRRAHGPVHIADDRGRATYLTACGKTLRGAAALVPTVQWDRGRRCKTCDEIADHAPTARILRIIAGW